MILAWFGILFDVVVLSVTLFSVWVIVFIIWLVRQQQIYQKEYNEQLGELKLEQRKGKT
jgi:hypothetical protein